MRCEDETTCAKLELVDRAAARPSWSVAQLNRAFVKHAEEIVADGPNDRAIGSRPLNLQLISPMATPLRAYLYTLTTHVSERQSGAFRAQIILPGHVRGSGSRAYLDAADAAFLVLGAYEPELETWVLWDATLYNTGSGIAYSQGIQVRDSTLYEAVRNGTATQERRPRRSYNGTIPHETVVAAHRDHLVDGLRLRWLLTEQRLLRGE